MSGEDTKIVANIFRRRQADEKSLAYHWVAHFLQQEGVQDHDMKDASARLMKRLESELKEKLVSGAIKGGSLDGQVRDYLKSPEGRSFRE